MDSGRIYNLIATLIDRMVVPEHEAWDVEFILCEMADKDHEREDRVYAHVFHHPWTICVCDRFEDLPDEHKAGILLHEFGHLYGGDLDAEADLWIDEELGIDIEYVDTIQWVALEDLR